MDEPTWHCAEPGCGRPKTSKAAKGLCGHHYGMQWRAGRPRIRKRPPERPCAIDGCQYFAFARLCNRHRRLYRLEKADPCIEPGCSLPAKTSGRCEGHYTRLSKYGLSGVQFAALLSSQGGQCAVCGVTQADSPYPLVVDHDHSCCPGRRTCGRCVRGVLCKSCNVGLGNLKDDPVILTAALSYLSSYPRN